MIRSAGEGGASGDGGMRLFECTAARVVQVVGGGVATRGQRPPVSAQQVIMAQVGGGTTMALPGLASHGTHTPPLTDLILMA